MEIFRCRDRLRKCRDLVQNDASINLSYADENATVQDALATDLTIELNVADELRRFKKYRKAIIEDHDDLDPALHANGVRGAGWFVYAKRKHRKAAKPFWFVAVNAAFDQLVHAYYLQFRARGFAATALVFFAFVFVVRHHHQRNKAIITSAAA